MFSRLSTIFAAFDEINIDLNVNALRIFSFLIPSFLQNLLEVNSLMIEVVNNINTAMQAMILSKAARSDFIISLNVAIYLSSHYKYFNIKKSAVR